MRKTANDRISQVEQSQETIEAPRNLHLADLTDVNSLAAELVAALSAVPDGDLVGEMVINAMKLLRDRTNRGDMKLINKAFKELRYAMKVFAPHHGTRKISIFGSARTPEDDPDYQAAADFARGMVDKGWMVTTGAGGGIMAAGHGGAGAEPSFGLAIRLPFEQKTNVHIAADKKLINFKYFFTRKLMFLRSSDAIALFPGGFGTMDEGFEVLTLVQTGKSVPVPIVCVEREGGTFWQRWLDYVRQGLLRRRLIDPLDLKLIHVTDNLTDAIDHVLRFYRNYHSLRYVRDDLVLRLRQAPDAKQLARINDRFGHLLARGEYRVSGPLPPERDEPALAHLPRLVFQFNRRDHAGLRLLIDHLNGLG
mgnify:FL=1